MTIGVIAFSATFPAVINGTSGMLKVKDKSLWFWNYLWKKTQSSSVCCYSLCFSAVITGCKQWYNMYAPVSDIQTEQCCLIIASCTVCLRHAVLVENVLLFSDFLLQVNWLVSAKPERWVGVCSWRVTNDTAQQMANVAKSTVTHCRKLLGT